MVTFVRDGVQIRFRRLNISAIHSKCSTAKLP